jgi:hypothetical protein
MGHINLHKLLLVDDALDNCHWNTTLAKLVIVGGRFYYYYSKQTVLLRTYPCHSDSNDIDNAVDLHDLMLSSGLLIW